MNVRGIATIVYGTAEFREQARTLARSVRYHNPGLPCAVITDYGVEADWPEFDQVIPLIPARGPGLRHRFHLDEYAPFPETIFMDCDCIVYGSLEPLWTRFAGVPVGVIGGRKTRGEWYGVAVQEILDRTGLPFMAGFNGGLYYVRKGEEAARVFRKAREFSARYDTLGFTRWRGDQSDEPVLALALPACGVAPIAEDGRSMNDTWGLQGSITADVLTGKARFTTYDKPVQPLVVHYCNHSNAYVYLREAFTLRLLGSRRFPTPGRAYRRLVTLSAGALARVAVVVKRLSGRTRGLVWRMVRYTQLLKSEPLLIGQS
jgi:hypothetical protein